FAVKAPLRAALGWLLRARNDASRNLLYGEQPRRRFRCAVVAGFEPFAAFRAVHPAPLCDPRHSRLLPGVSKHDGAIGRPRRRTQGAQKPQRQQRRRSFPESRTALSAYLRGPLGAGFTIA